MSVYRDNLSAITFYRLSLSLNIVWIYRYRFINIFCYRRQIIAINDFLCTQCPKLGIWRYGKIHGVD